MFDYSTIKTGFDGLIGFRSAKDPGIPNLDTGLTASSSGLYFSDFCPLVNTENLEAILLDSDGYDYDTYSGAATYSTGDYVISSNIAWVSKENSNVGNTPAVGDHWETALSVELEEKKNSALNKLLNKLTTHKKLSGNTKTYLSNVQLFDGTSSNGDTIAASGRFVGFQIELKKANNIKATVDRIGLRFTQAQSDLTLYLFHSSRNTAIATATVSTSTGYNFEWKTPSEWDLSYVDYADNIDAGGKWYIGYFEADISGNAINKNYDFSSGGCGSCGGADEYYFNLWSQYLTVRPIEVVSSDLNGTDLFDVSKVGIQWTQNYGINVAFSVKSDFTEMAVNNKNLFVQSWGLQFSADMLNEMAYNANARINTRESNVEAARALEALSGVEGVKGISQQLEESITGLAVDFAGISPVLPKEGKGLRYGAL